MIMNELRVPRCSVLAAGAALGLCAAAWIAPELQACPPGSDSCSPAPAVAKARQADPVYHVYRVGDGAEIQVVQPSGMALSLGAMPDPLGPDQVNARIDQLEQRVDRLAKLLKDYMASRQGQTAEVVVAPAAAAASPSAMRARIAPSAAPAPPAPPAFTTVAPPPPPAAPRGAIARTMPAPGVPGAPVATRTPDSAGDGEKVNRVYRLPEGKLEALTALMSRQDVPVLISPRDDGIEVIATPEQHKAFQAFVELINPSAAMTAVPGR